MPIKRLLALACGLLLAACITGTSPNVVHTQVGSRNATGATGAPLSGVGSYAGCMAVVVAARQAVVAAHCVQVAPNASVDLLLGDNLNLPKFRIPVLQIAAHPLFSPSTRAYDVAVLTLGADAQVAPLAVVDRLPDDALGATLQAAGFGASDSGTRSASGALQVLPVSLETLGPLQLRWDNASPCLGDNGAPLIYTDMAGGLLLAALTSSTTTADCSGQTVATRLDVVAGVLKLPTQTPAQTSPSADDGTDVEVPCASVPTRGQCNGLLLTYCDGDTQTLQTQNCGTSGGHCIWSYTEQQFACGPAPDSAAQAGCSGASFAGRCDGNVAVWCRDGKTVVRDDCTPTAKQCGYNLVLGYTTCLAPGTQAG